MEEGEIPKQHVGCICGHRGVVEGEEGPVVRTSILRNYFWRVPHKSCVHHVISELVIGSSGSAHLIGFFSRKV
jgi:hypothetical protein